MLSTFVILGTSCSFKIESFGAGANQGVGIMLEFLTGCEAFASIRVRVSNANYRGKLNDFSFK